VHQGLPKSPGFVVTCWQALSGVDDYWKKGLFPVQPALQRVLEYQDWAQRAIQGLVG